MVKVKCNNEAAWALVIPPSQDHLASVLSQVGSHSSQPRGHSQEETFLTHRGRAGAKGYHCMRLGVHCPGRESCCHPREPGAKETVLLAGEEVQTTGQES